MPVYVYKNLTTGATFEIEQRITEDALAVDPTSGDPVKRLIQPVGIAFKGSGFYVTDSRKRSSVAPKVGPVKDAAITSDAPPPKAAEKPAAASSSAAGD